MDPGHSHCRVNKHALVPEGCPHAAPAKYIQRSIRGGDFRGFYWHGCSSYSWPCAVTGGESPVSGGPPSGTPRRSGSMWTDPESADPSGAPPKSHSLFPFSIEPRETTPSPSVVWTMDRRLRLFKQHWGGGLATPKPVNWRRCGYFWSWSSATVSEPSIRSGPARGILEDGESDAWIICKFVCGINRVLNDRWNTGHVTLERQPFFERRRPPPPPPAYVDAAGWVTGSGPATHGIVFR